MEGKKLSMSDSWSIFLGVIVKSKFFEWIDYVVRLSTASSSAIVLKALHCINYMSQ